MESRGLQYIGNSFFLFLPNKNEQSWRGLLKYCPNGKTSVSVHLPERFGSPPCTFGTQLNVFSRESSAFQSYPVLQGYLILSILRRAFAAFLKSFIGYLFDTTSIHIFYELSIKNETFQTNSSTRSSPITFVRRSISFSLFHK